MFILILGFFVHIIFLLSVFDIYFKSPIINHLPVIPNSIKPPAKRLVLIVGDGLRTDSLFGRNIDGSSNAPYLRSLLETEASWGICHTRVPTESRPGHVAMIAGFYEDPSAIFKGWQDNLVEFDSLFNRSHLTLGWGSPDIVPMFNKGNVAKNMVLKSYPSDFQSFFGSVANSFALNSWVFESVNRTFLEAETKESGKQLKQQLNEERVILFLHLLATDVSGHSDKPKSKEFANVLQRTDAAIESIVQVINQFYHNDDKTLFVFASDHGMTDWGSHGDGSDVETETPFIIWGPGVKKPEILAVKREDDQWGLGHLARHDFNQADLVPLLAVLIGISIPVHSVGILPLEFLNVTEHEKAQMLQLNMQQINNQYLKLHDRIEEQSLSMFYFPFKKLSKSLDLAMKTNISTLLANKRYSEVIMLSNDLIHLSLEGLNYYQNYYQYFLLCCVSLSYFGWIFALLADLANISHLKFSESKSYKFSHLSRIHISIVDIAFIFISAGVVIFTFAQRLSLQFYIYGLLPAFLWWLALKYNAAFLLKVFFSSLNKYWLVTLGYFFGIELLVLTFFYRWPVSIVLVALIGWPLSNYKLLKRKRCQHLLCLWIISSLSLASFLFMPVVGVKANIYYIVAAGILWLIFIAIILFIPSFEQFFLLEQRKKYESYLDFNVSRHLIALMISILNCVFISNNLEVKSGLSIINQIISWILLGNSLIVPVNFINRGVSFRLIILFLSMATPQLSLSISHEALFFFNFSAHLLLWFALEYQIGLRVERGVIGEGKLDLSPTTWRRGFFFLTFILVSFFGAGNIASINSFDVMTVRCFIAVFSPFLMMSLIILRILIPFLLVATAFLCLYLMTKDSISQLLLIIFIFCDLLGLHFLFFVKNVGSWKEIGMSLSHYVIVESTILFVLIILGLGHVYLKQYKPKKSGFSFRQYLLMPKSVFEKKDTLTLEHLTPTLNASH